jgi:hypothetical protein
MATRLKASFYGKENMMVRSGERQLRRTQVIEVTGRLWKTVAGQALKFQLGFRLIAAVICR